MVTANLAESEALYHGLRMRAEEYFALQEDGFRYELIDGVVCLSPTCTLLHQKVLTYLVGETGSFLQSHPIGNVFVSLDVLVGTRPDGSDMVYRPDLVFLRADKAARNRERIREAPDLVVELTSNATRRFDSGRKKDDYERAGIPEYWIVDPDKGKATFYRLTAGRYEEVAPEGERFASAAIPGFVLDLPRLRRSFTIPRLPGRRR